MMTKVVINKRYGGFGLSSKGTIAYLKRQGKECFFYAPGSGDQRQVYHKVEDPDNTTAFFLMACTVDKGDEIDLSKDDVEGNFYSWGVKRDDPDLIAVVEELGSEADGDHAGLEIVEVPDDVDWEIEEYDGLEWVAEKHRTWR